jgi:hypothetical protein
MIDFLLFKSVLGAALPASQRRSSPPAAPKVLPFNQ